jgi:hypothetical protein
MKLSEIITALVAVYGAVLSTIAIVKQLQGDSAKVVWVQNLEYGTLGDDCASFLKASENRFPFAQNDSFLFEKLILS